MSLPCHKASSTRCTERSTLHGTPKRGGGRLIPRLEGVVREVQEKFSLEVGAVLSIQSTSVPLGASQSENLLYSSIARVRSAPKARCRNIASAVRGVVPDRKECDATQQTPTPLRGAGLVTCHCARQPWQRWRHHDPGEPRASHAGRRHLDADRPRRSDDGRHRGFSVRRLLSVDGTDPHLLGFVVQPCDRRRSSTDLRSLERKPRGPRACLLEPATLGRAPCEASRQTRCGCL